MDSWLSKSPMPTNRGVIAASTFKSTFFVFGGESIVRTFDDTEQYFPHNDTWIIL